MSFTRQSLRSGKPVVYAYHTFDDEKGFQKKCGIVHGAKIGRVRISLSRMLWMPGRQGKTAHRSAGRRNM
jgi:hypothetical protein